MTIQEKQIKVAELCGWIKFFEEFRSVGEDVGRWYWHKGNENVKTKDLPPYTTSIDSIRAAVLAQSEAFQVHFQDKLLSRVYEHRWIHCLSAEIWADAFLAAHDASMGKAGSL